MGTAEKIPTRMPLKVITFDWGHTLMDAHQDEHITVDTRPIYLMPGVADVRPQFTLLLAVWANARVARETTVRGSLDRAVLGTVFHWVFTSVDAGARKPVARARALKCKTRGFHFPEIQPGSRSFSCHEQTGIDPKTTYRP